MADRHLDRRQVLRAMLLGGAGLAVPAACGLPTGGHPIIDGPPATTQPGGGGALTKAPTPADGTNPTLLVQAFFGAVAGRFDGENGMSAANQHALNFLTGRARASWPQPNGGPNGGITVVRVEPGFDTTVGNGGNTVVTASVTPTGSIQADNRGWVGPPADTTPRRLQFTVTPTADASRAPGYLISDIQTLDLDPNDPPWIGMMLDSSLLDGLLFTRQLIYFWTADRSGLVPDLRYVPKAGVSRELQYTAVVDWVLLGPSDFLHDAVQANLFEGNNIVGPNLTAPDSDGLLVNLTNPPPQGLRNDQVMAQLRWSLRQLYDDTVRLEVNSQPQNVDGSSTEFRHWNLADRPVPSETVYCVTSTGMVVPQTDPTNPPPILDPDVNKGVRAAALSTDLKSAALIKTTENRLYIGEAGTSGKPTFTVASRSGRPLEGTTWTRPVYLPFDSRRVLVGVDNSLYLVGIDGAAVQLPNPNNGLMPVSAFALAPDGRRIAVISAGLPYVLALKVNGNDISFVGQQQPQALNVGLAVCTAVAWSGLDTVLIAGRLPGGGGYQIMEATIDGAIVKAFNKDFSFNNPIDSLVTLPPPAWDPSSSSVAALVKAGNEAHSVNRATHSQLTFPTPTPTPSASGAPQGPQFGTPTYPFYLG